ncbi:MAG: hypothetical protein IPK60_06275 [Sandaracinaceae bacterium]|nr:hypothetical protein [Sandaracinaceae bacterium]
MTLSFSRNAAESSERRSLTDDQRGAIMVMGIFMAMLMVGFIYYVSGLGQAVLFRERMQDSSDAGAWAAAVIHARGMNIIAFLNMLMGAIAAVLIALKIILLMCQIASIVCKILCAIPYTAYIGCPLEGPVDALKEGVSEAHDAMQDFADEVLPILTKAERAIAKAIPALAEVKVVAMSLGVLKHPVSFGFMYSKTIRDFSLPVEDDECSRIEEEGKAYIGDLITRPFSGGMAAILDKVMGALGDVAMMINGKVCGDGGSETTNIDMSGMVDENDNGECDGDDEPDWCDTDESGQIQGAQSGSAGDETHPQKVKEDCNLGDKCFQLRVFMIAEDGWLTRGLKGAQLGNWGRSVDQSGMDTFELLTRISVAQSEFFYDEADAHTLRDDWMWHMQWRARMRRFSLGDVSMMTDACGSSGGDICDGLSTVTDILENVLVH